MPRKKKIDELVVVRLLNQAKASIDRPTEVNRLLREIGKFFDVQTGRAMIDGDSRRRIVTLLDGGEKAEALAAIDRYFDAFQRRIEPESPEQSPLEQGSSACSA